MGLQWRRRRTLDGEGDFQAYVNYGSFWPSITVVLLKRVVFNTKDLFSSIRLGKGLSWKDRD